MPYNSALDLPSFAEMEEQLRVMKLFKLVLQKDGRNKLTELEDDLKSLTTTIDKFYDTLGEKNWIFHEMLNVSKINEILSNNPNSYEEKFIEIYKDEKNLSFFINQLKNIPQLKTRNELILKAKDDYLNGRYYSTVFILLSVIDGFVNDFEKRHKGFHARDSEEFGTLDSVVSHHKGISRIHRIYTKSFSITKTEPVYDLYRNGIMHGIILDFNNIIVATKAWNLLFSIKDWATAKLKSDIPKKKEKTWGEILTQIKENNVIKNELEQWKPSVLNKDNNNFKTDPIFIACKNFLDFWNKKNYGEMAKFLMKNTIDSYGSSSPKYIRGIYEGENLEKYEIININHITPAICEVSLVLKIKGKIKEEKVFRWIYESIDGNPINHCGSKLGMWKLVLGY